MQERGFSGVEAARHLAKNLWSTPLLSSEALGWRGLVARRYLNIESGSVVLPPLDDNVLIFTVGGATRIDGKMERAFSGAIAAPGACFLTPRGTPSRWYNAEQVDVLHLYIRTEALVDLVAGSGYELPERLELRELCAHSDPLLEQLAHGLLGELASPHPQGLLYADSLIQTLSAHLVRHYCGLPPRGLRRLNPWRGGLEPQALVRVCDYIHANLAGDLRLEVLAAVANLSPYHFARLFRRTTGLAVHQYVIRERVEAAKGLLRAGEGSVSAVAVQVGFSDHSHLARHFRRFVGVSPARFRARLWGGDE